MTITPGPPYDDRTTPRSRRGVPVRFVLLGALLLLILVVTSTGSVRGWWAHRLHDVTDGSWAADFVIGVVVGMLPLLGMAAGAFRTRGPRRAFRMFLWGALGFIATYLLAPSPARYLAHHDTARVFEHQAPGYLPGVLTGVLVWLALLAFAIARARAWWRRFTGQRAARDRDDRGPSHRVIDI